MQSEIVPLFERLLELSETLLQKFEESQRDLSDMSSIHQLMLQRGQLIDDLMLYPYQTLSEEERRIIEKKMQLLQSMDPQIQLQVKQSAMQLNGRIRELRGTKSVIAHYKLSLSSPSTKDRLA